MVSLWTISPFLLGMSLGLVTIFGDHLVSTSQTNWQKAIFDNATHGVIGLLTWAIVVLASKQFNAEHMVEILACGVLASAVDIDHFIAARSFSLEAAKSLPSRPIFHCTSAPVAIFGTLVAVAYTLEHPSLHRFAWLALAAICSHHLRDATRRGFWLWPLGSTPPVPHVFYVGGLVILPFAIRSAMSATAIQPAKEIGEGLGVAIV